MARSLVIVESPAKAKTINKYLGRNYMVKASYGHVMDLPRKELGINIKRGFEPTYEVSPEKADVVEGFRKPRRRRTPCTRGRPRPRRGSDLRASGGPFEADHGREGRQERVEWRGEEKEEKAAKAMKRPSCAAITSTG